MEIAGWISLGVIIGIIFVEVLLWFSCRDANVISILRAKFKKHN
jgi:hypothetical protein